MSKVFTTNWYLQKSYFTAPIISKGLNTDPCAGKK